MNSIRMLMLMLSFFVQSAHAVTEIEILPPERPKKLESCPRLITLENASPVTVIPSSFQVSAQSTESVRIRERLPAEGEQTTLSSDGAYAAIKMRDGDSYLLKVYKIKTEEVVLNERFSNISYVQFLPNSSLIAVNGSKASDGRTEKLYLLSVDSNDQKKLLEQVKPKPSSSPTLFTSWMTPWTGGGRGNQLAKKDPANGVALNVPGTDFGPNVKKIISRVDLPNVVVIQNGANATRSLKVKFQGRYVDTLEGNKSAYLYNPETMARVGKLSFKNPSRIDGGDRSPIDGEINPKSTLAGFIVEDPIRAYFNRPGVVIVDLKKPDQEIYRYDSAEDGDAINMRIGWSHDGDRLFILDKNTKTLVIKNFKSGDEVRHDLSTIISDGPGEELGGAAFLDSGDLMIAKGIFESRWAVAFVDTYLLPQNARQNEIKGPVFSLNFMADVNRDNVRYYHTFKDRGISVEIVEMRNHQVKAFLVNGQLILVNSDNPRSQTTIAPSTDAHGKGVPIQSMAKISEDVLRITNSRGTFDVDVSAKGPR